MTARHVRVLLAAFCGVCVAACQSGPSYAPKAPCAPTCAGGSGASAYGGFEEARRAFTRSTKDSAFTATLEDVAWLRFEGDEETTVKQHRAYFEQGYTTFQIVLRTKDFTQPTGESFVLEDSSGARQSGRPVTYQGSMGQEQEKYAARFSVSFRHAITSELAWVRLTRAADGGTLEWTFPGDTRGLAPGSQAAPSPVVPVGRVVKGRAVDSSRVRALRPEDPETLPSAPEGPSSLGTSYADLPPAPVGGRPANLLTQPSAGGAPLPPAGDGRLPVEPAYERPLSAAVPAPAAPLPAPSPTPRPAPSLGLPPSGALPAPQVRSLR